MDPNVTLHNLMVLTARCLEGEDFDSTDAEEMAFAADSLHVWIANGGFLPDAWKTEEAQEAQSIRLATHAEVVGNEESCDGFLGQTMLGDYRCAKCDAYIYRRNMIEPDPDQTGIGLITALAVHTDHDMIELIKRMKETVHEESATQADAEAAGRGAHAEEDASEEDDEGATEAEAEGSHT